MKGISFSNKVYFDKYNPNSDDGTDTRKSLAGLDYSPLPRLTGRSLSMGVLVSMGGLIFGYDTGQISGFLAMPDFLLRFGLRHTDGTPYFSDVRSGLIVAMLSIGTLIGALAAAPIADRIGRRASVWVWSVVVAVGFVIQIASVTAWYQFMIGRIVAGVGVGALSVLVPMFQAETAPPWIRGALVCTYQLFITLGIFLAACFNYGTYTHQQNNSGSWRIVLGIGWVWVAILGVGILAFPETPRYAYRKGRHEECKQTLMKVYGAPAHHYAIHTQMEEIASKFRAEDQNKGNVVVEFVRMVKAPRMAYRLGLGIMLQAFQQLTGANYFFYYGTVIFSSVQISPFVTQMILNGVNFGTTFIGLYMVEHYGRRKCLIGGSIWMFVCFIIFASVGHFALDYNNPVNTPAAGVALIVFACLFILGYATTWGPMVWTLIAELFPSRYRAKGMAISTASNWTWNFLIAFFTPFITTAIDFRYGYVFAGCNLLAGLLVYFLVVEGQGRTLEEIDTMYIEHVNPIKSSKWVAPPAEEIARIRKEAGTDDNAPPPELQEKLSGDTERGGGPIDSKGEQSQQYREAV